MSKDTWGIEMVCFTDMPLSMSGDHCEKYSKFAAVFSKPALANCCVCPVAYMLNPFVSNAYSYLYHIGIGLAGIADGKELTKGNRAGERFSLDRYMQHLHHFLAWMQDYGTLEFPYVEGTIESNETQLSFFDDPAAYYYEREWRAVYRPGDKFSWVHFHDGRAYFRFADSSLKYLIVPEGFQERAIQDLSVMSYVDTPTVMSFEEVSSGVLG